MYRPTQLKAFLPCPCLKAVKTQRKPLSPTQALAWVRVQLPTLRCFQSYSLPSELEAWIGSDVSKRNPFAGKHSRATWTCAAENLPHVLAFTSICFLSLGWGERQWQWTAASAFSHEVLRNGVVAACRNPHLELLSSDVHSLRWNTAMDDSSGWPGLFHPVFSLPSGSCIPKLAGTMEVIARHKGFTISTSTSVQDLTRGTAGARLRAVFLKLL